MIVVYEKKMQYYERLTKNNGVYYDNNDVPILKDAGDEKFAIVYKFRDGKHLYDVEVIKVSILYFQYSGCNTNGNVMEVQKQYYDKSVEFVGIMIDLGMKENL